MEAAGGASSPRGDPEGAALGDGGRVTPVVGGAAGRGGAPGGGDRDGLTPEELILLETPLDLGLGVDARSVHSHSQVTVGNGR